MTTTTAKPTLQEVIAKAMKDAESKRIGEFLKADDVFDMLLDIANAAHPN